MKLSNYFVDRETAVTVRVEKVTPHFASITVVKQLPSTYMMPVTEYDTVFVRRYLPLDIGSIKVPADFRLPANADEWAVETTPAPEPEDEGVKIGEDAEVAPAPADVEPVETIGGQPIANPNAPSTLEDAYAAVRDRATY